MIWIVCPQQVTRTEWQWSMVSEVPSSLRSASLRLKQNYIFCMKDLSFDAVEALLLLRYYEINDTVISLYHTHEVLFGKFSLKKIF